MQLQVLFLRETLANRASAKYNRNQNHNHNRDSNAVVVVVVDVVVVVVVIPALPFSVPAGCFFATPFFGGFDGLGHAVARRLPATPSTGTTGCSQPMWNVFCPSIWPAPRPLRRWTKRSLMTLQSQSWSATANLANLSMVSLRVLIPSGWLP